MNRYKEDTQSAMVVVSKRHTRSKRRCFFMFNRENKPDGVKSIFKFVEFVSQDHIKRNEMYDCWDAQLCSYPMMYFEYDPKTGPCSIHYFKGPPENKYESPNSTLWLSDNI